MFYFSIGNSTLWKYRFYEQFETNVDMFQVANASLMLIISAMTLKTGFSIKRSVQLSYLKEIRSELVSLKL